MCRCRRGSATIRAPTPAHKIGASWTALAVNRRKFLWRDAIFALKHWTQIWVFVFLSFIVSLSQNNWRWPRISKKLINWNIHVIYCVDLAIFEFATMFNVIRKKSAKDTIELELEFVLILYPGIWYKITLSLFWLKIILLIFGYSQFHTSARSQVSRKATPTLKFFLILVFIAFLTKNFFRLRQSP